MKFIFSNVDILNLPFPVHHDPVHVDVAPLPVLGLHPDPDGGEVLNHHPPHLPFKPKPGAAQPAHHLDDGKSMPKAKA